MPVQQSAFARIEPAALREGVSVNRFRQKRGRLLRQQIEALADRLGRDIVILDVGGRPDYWAQRRGRADRPHRRDELPARRSSSAALPPGGAARALHLRRVGDARSTCSDCARRLDRPRPLQLGHRARGRLERHAQPWPRR